MAPPLSFPPRAAEAGTADWRSRRFPRSFAVIQPPFARSHVRTVARSHGRTFLRTLPPLPAVSVWRLRTRTLSLRRPLVMGILNLTPDSFSDGGRLGRAGAALAHARRL